MFSNYTSISWIEIDGEAPFNFVSCEGEDGQTNDLGTYYQQLFSQSKVNETQKASFDKTVVGDGNCPAAFQDVYALLPSNSSLSPSIAPSSLATALVRECMLLPFDLRVGVIIISLYCLLRHHRPLTIDIWVLGNARVRHIKIMTIIL
jgi:hypothetical protein